MKTFVLKAARCAALTLGVLWIWSGASRAETDIIVYPTRAVMTDRQRTAQVDVVNTSQIKASYKISLVRKRMTDAGGIEEVTRPGPGEQFADDLVKFSPRQVTLLPGAGQTIRMIFKAPTDLAEGEYRSHLVFTKMASGSSDLVEKEDPNPTTVSMRVTVNVGISIPVIARHGKLEAKATIDPSSVKVTAVEPKQQQVEFTLGRTGTRSIFGDIAIYRGEDKVAVGSGFSVYVPNGQRKVGLRVLEPHQLKSGENIRLVFTEKDEKKPMAETTLTLP